MGNTRLLKSYGHALSLSAALASSIEPGQNQSGLAIDLEHQRLFIGCRNELMVMVDATNGKVLAQVPIGAGTDSSWYDPGSKLAFSSTGQ